VDALAH